MRVKARSSSSDVRETVYAIQSPSGLTTGAPTERVRNMSVGSIGRRSCASSGDEKITPRRAADTTLQVIGVVGRSGLRARLDMRCGVMGTRWAEPTDRTGAGWDGRRAGPHHYAECLQGDREGVQHPSGPGGGQVRVRPRATNLLQSGHFLHGGIRADARCSIGARHHEQRVSGGCRAGLLERPLSRGLRLLGQIPTAIRVRRHSPRKNRRARDGVTALCDERLLLTRVA